LIELRIVTLASDGSPKLTKYGEKCFVILESGEGEVSELANYDANIRWPKAISTRDRKPAEGSLVIAWKPIIDGWDVVRGRVVVKMPDQYTYWLPMIPRPE
jgi:hypothetical protein